MKNHVWVRYGSHGETVEIIIRDFSGAKIEGWKVNATDRKRLKQIFRRIRDKYSINLFIEIKDEDRDIGWIP